MELDTELQMELHMEPHMEPHMGLHMELHMEPQMELHMPWRDPPLLWTTTRVLALDLALWRCHDATIPSALVGRAAGPLIALVGPPGPLRARP